MNKNFFKFYIATFFFSYLIIYPVISNANQLITGTITQSDKSARIILNNLEPEEVKFTLTQNIINVKLAKADKLNITGTSKPHIISILNNGAQASLTLADNNYRIRKFVGINEVGIDIIRTTDSKPPIASAEKKENQKKQNNNKPQKLDNKIINKTDKSKQASKKEAGKKDTLTPVIIPIQPKPKSDTKPNSDKPVQQLPVTKQLNAADNPQKNNAPPILTPSVPRPNVVNEQNNIITPNKLSVSKNQTNFKITFNWNKKVAAASFYRAGYLWVIFSSYDNFDIDKLVSTYSDDFKKGEIIDNSTFTIIRFKGNLANNRMNNDGTKWILEINTNPIIEIKPNKIIKEYKSKFSKGIFFPAENMLKDKVTITDPDIGDNIVAVLFNNGNIGTPYERSFVDFQIIRAGQGFAIKPFADNLDITIIKQGIEIINSDDPANSKKNVDDTGKAKSGFVDLPANDDKPAILDPKTPLISNSPPPILSKDNILRDDIILDPVDDKLNIEAENKKYYVPNKITLLNGILAAPQKEKNVHRYALARFYFENGMIPESYGVIKTIKKQNNNYFDTPEKSLFIAINEYLLGRYGESADKLNAMNDKELSEPLLSEVTLWRTLINIYLHQPPKSLDLPNLFNNIIKYYPKNVRSEIMLKLLANNVANNKIKESKILMKLLLRDNPDLYTRNSVLFYKALLANANDLNEEALKIWRKVATDAQDRMNRARSSLEIIKSMLNDNQIEAMDAISRLERIRVVWKGDNIEFEALKLLADLYNKEKKYIEALRVWKDISSEYSNLTDSLMLASNMSKTFSNLFVDKDYAKSLSDLDAVALYYEFRELTPIGKIGDQIVQQLANRLINLDLLDKAAALLSHQTTYRLKGKEKYIGINKLALVYILDHKPEKALAVLSVPYDVKDTDIDIKKNKIYLQSKALIDLKRYDEALNKLDIIDYPEFIDLKLDIYWRTGDWQNASMVLERKLMEKDASQITQEDQKNLIRLAVCYNLTNRRPAITNMMRNFAAIVDTNSNLKKTLEFLQEEVKPIDYRTFNESVGIDLIENYIKNYKASLNK